MDVLLNHGAIVQCDDVYVGTRLHIVCYYL